MKFLTDREKMRKRRCGRGGSWLLLLVVLIFALQTTLYLTTATETVNGDGDANSSTSDTIKTSAKEEPVKEEDWGSFYDPKEIFCGKYDCYKILGFDYLTFHVTKPSLKDITKSYRSLSRLWHPDKNRKKGAKEKFVVSIYNKCFVDLHTFHSLNYLSVRIILIRKSQEPTKSSPTKKSETSTITTATDPMNTSTNTARRYYGPTSPNPTPLSSSSAYSQPSPL